MITGKIDVLKIPKDKLYKGEKGTYLDFVLIETPNSQYGDYMVKRNVTKEEREAGIDGEILGNAKIFKKAESNKKPDSTNKAKKEDDDLPF